MTRSHDDEPEALSLPGDVLDDLLEGCQVIGFDYTYLYINELAAEQGRLAKDQLLGRTMMACFPGIDQTPMFGLLRRCLTERTPEEMENEFEFPDGARIVFALKFVPVPQGACILSLDITERRHRLAAIVQDSDDAIVSRRLDGIITSWNRGAERMFGYRAGEMLGQHYRQLFAQVSSAEVDAINAQIERGEHLPSFEAVRTHKDGHQIEVSLTLSPYRDAAGKVLGISMIARDITQLKQIQRELVAAKEAAESANRELEAFAYSVAHDLRAPLRHIDGFGAALLEDFADQLGDEARSYLRRIRHSTALMTRLIEDLLKLSQATRRDLVHGSVDISTLARASVERLRAGEPERDVEVTIEPGLRAYGDPPLITLALDNLIGNAWKFTGKRTGAQIAITAAEGGICVRDNGVGFDMAYAKNLFAPFQRLHADHEFEGTGIGLATVQRIVHRHGGRIRAHGEVGVGAAFTFTLGDPPAG